MPRVGDPIPPLEPKLLPELNGQGDCSQLAIDLFDLDRVDPLLQERLLTGRLDGSGIVKVSPKQRAVALSCPLLEAAMMCEAIRRLNRAAGDRVVRIYFRPVGKSRWVQLPMEMVLLSRDGDGWRLHNFLRRGDGLAEPKKHVPLIPLPSNGGVERIGKSFTTRGKPVV